jgi:hypothetical protein
MVDENKSFSRSPNILEETFPDSDSIVVVSPSGKQWLVLKGTAIDVWRLTERHQTVDGLTKDLLDKYSADYDVIYEDVKSVLNKLISLGIVSYIEV